MAKQYKVLSPDNIPINCDGGVYPSKKKAIEALKNWVNNYRTQGYYSQVCYNGYVRHIPIVDLLDYCNIEIL